MVTIFPTGLGLIPFSMSAEALGGSEGMVKLEVKPLVVINFSLHLGAEGLLLGGAIPWMVVKFRPAYCCFRE